MISCPSNENSPVHPIFAFLDINFSIDFIFFSLLQIVRQAHNIGFIISHFLTTFSFCLLCLILSLNKFIHICLHIIKFFLSRIQVITRSLHLITQIIQLSIIITFNRFNIAIAVRLLFISYLLCFIKTIQSIVYRFHGCGYDGFIPSLLRRFRITDSHFIFLRHGLHSTV